MAVGRGAAGRSPPCRRARRHASSPPRAASAPRGRCQRARHGSAVRARSDPAGSVEAMTGRLPRRSAARPAARPARARSRRGMRSRSPLPPLTIGVVPPRTSMAAAFRRHGSGRRCAGISRSWQSAHFVACGGGRMGGDRPLGCLDRASLGCRRRSQRGHLRRASPLGRRWPRVLRHRRPGRRHRRGSGRDRRRRRRPGQGRREGARGAEPGRDR